MRERAGGLVERVRPEAGQIIAGTLLPFLLVFYLALRDGGYDAVVRSEVAIALWWLILLGALIGILPSHRLGRLGWGALAVFAGLAVWTGLGLLWSESPERSATEVARVVSLLAVFALALSAGGADFLRRSVLAIGAAIALIAVLAVGSRFHPDLFPANEVIEALPTEQARLNYPLTYWNGLATLVAIGAPLLVWAAASARSRLVQSAAAAALPLLGLVLFFTISRGGLAQTAVALAVLIVLHPRRLLLVSPLLLGGAGGALLIFAANRRSELTDGLLSPTAFDQGTEMTWITLGVCATVALITFAIGRLGLRARIESTPVPRRIAWFTVAGTALAVLAAAIAVGAPGELGDRWQEFKEPTTPGDDASRFAAASGSGRYQWWAEAVDAGESEPLLGIGPGTYEFWWTRDDSTELGFVRDAHSLYLESFAELGIVGAVLILVLVGGILVVGLRRSLSGRNNLERTSLLAAATAACVAFAAAAAIDWAWEMTVLPVTFLLLGAGILLSERPKGGGLEDSPGTFPRAAGAIAATAAIVVIAIPMLSISAVRESQDQVNDGDLAEALDSAGRAENLMPFAATPNVQQALILELDGQLEEAREEAVAATRDEPTNWRTWLVLSRIQAELGEVAPATSAYEEARSLNPRSDLFSE